MPGFTARADAPNFNYLTDPFRTPAQYSGIGVYLAISDIALNAPSAVAGNLVSIRRPPDPWGHPQHDISRIYIVSSARRLRYMD